MVEFMEIMKEGWDGFSSVRDAPVDESAIAEALDLFTNANRLKPHQHAYLVQEAIATSDFPTLLGNVIDRQLLANYKLPSTISEWRQYIKVAPGGIPDFNDVERNRVDGIDQRLLKISDGVFQPAKQTSTQYKYHLDTYGRVFEITRKALINDALGAFSDISTRFARAALRTEAYFATNLFCTSSGPNSSFFGASISDAGQTITNLGALPLTINNLETTLTYMSEQKDPQGEAIEIEGVHLVVPPALFITAKSILTSSNKFYVDVQGGAGASIMAYPTANVLADMPIQLHKNPTLNTIDTSGKVRTTWYLFADPAEGAAIEVGFLRGQEGPEICMKASDKMSVSGGAMSPFAGSFDSDKIAYRVRHDIGGATMDPRLAYAQTGS
nr:Mu-like prophage major head subunit gpT family protein [uncultured Methanoregula sp.]